MKQIENITDDAIQTHIILFNETEITLKLRFYELTAIWVIDVSYKDKSVTGVKLSAGTLHIRSNNFPFDFAVSSENGLDPYLITSFSDEICNLYLLEADEMTAIRGVEVEI